MKGRDIIIEYTSQDGERIKVVSGRVVRTGIFASSEKKYGIFSTRVYVNKKLVEEFLGRGDGINLRDIPLIRPRLEELAEGCASSEELISTLRNYAAEFSDANELVNDGIEVPWFSDNR